MSVLRKWNNYDSVKLFGKQFDQRVIPSGKPGDDKYTDDGWEPRATTISDNFNRANENLEVSANWSLLDASAGTASFDILSNQCREDGGTSSRSGALHATSLDSDDHYSQVTIETLTAPGSTRNDGGAYARMSGNSGKHNGYVYQVTIDSVSAINGRMAMNTGTTPTNTVLVDQAEMIVVTDTIRVETDGDQITGKINGTITAGPVTNGTISGVLQCGLEGRIQNGSVGDIILDNWEAGDLAVAPAQKAYTWFF